MKKFTLVVSAIGLLSLAAVSTSCVKDNESQSVTDIRNAKTEQLKAMASLNKAQAEAVLITANADKVVKEAEAELFKAQAAVQQALAEGSKIDVENARLDYELKKATAQIKIDAAIANAEVLKITALANLKIAQEQAKANALNNPYLTQLIANYGIVTNELVGAQGDLTTAKTALIGLEFGLKSWEVTRDQDVAAAELDKAALVMQKDALVALSKTATDYKDVEKAIAEAKAKQVTLGNDLKAKRANQQAASSALSTSLLNVGKTDYFTALKAIATSAGSAGQPVHFVNTAQKKFDEISKMPFNGMTYDKVDFVDQSKLSQSVVDSYEMTVKPQAKQVETTQKAFDDAKKAEAAANTAMVKAKAEWDAKPDDAALKSDYDTKKADYDAKQQTTVAAYNALAVANRNLEAANGNYDVLKRNVDIAMSADKKAEYDALMTEWLAADMAEIDMRIAIAPIQTESSALFALISSLQTQSSALPNFTDLIATVDGQIIAKEQSIANSKDIQGKDALIAQKKAQITTLEALVASFTAQATAISAEIQKETAK